jgi:diguanylate cyclase (GGDEF)-like protein/PAS domain S-box-containing protein
VADKSTGSNLLQTLLLHGVRCWKWFQTMLSAYRGSIRRTWIVCIVFIATIASWTVYIAWSERQTAMSEKAQDVTNLSLVLAEQTSRHIAVVDLVLQALQIKLQDTGVSSKAGFVDRISKPDIRDYLVAKLQNIPGDNALLLLDEKGRLVNYSRPGDALPNTNATDRDYFSHFRDHNDGGLYISAPLMSRTVGSWRIFLSRRVIAPDGQFLGVIAAAVDIQYLQTFYQSILAGSSQTVTLLRRDGVVLTRYPDDGGAIGTSMPTNSPWYAVIANRGGTYRSPGFFGARPSIVAARPLRDYPLVIDVVVTVEDALAPWRIGAIHDAEVAFVFLLVIVSSFWMISRQIRLQESQNNKLNEAIKALSTNEIALRQSRSRLALATESASIGIWDWDVLKNVLVWDARMYELYGIREQDFSGAYSAWQAGLHPEDRVRGDAAIADALHRVKDFSIEFRVVWPNGEIRHIEAHALVQRVGDGRATRMIGVNWDITDRKRAEDALSESETRYRDLFEATRDAIMVVEPSTGTFTSANSSALEMFKAGDEAEFLRHNPWEYSPERQPDGRISIDKAQEMIQTAMRNGTHFFEWAHTRTDGSQFTADVLLTRVDREKEALLYATVRDITERKLVDGKIAWMARYDNLTGLVNRRVFVDVLEHTIARARRSGIQFAVLFLDLDNFKDVNDALGHPVGDALLKALAERLRATVREVDTVARFGGDEFAILLNDIDEPSAGMAVSERTLTALSEQIAIRGMTVAVAAGIAEEIMGALAQPVLIEANRIYSSASVGIAIYGSDSPDSETVLSHADMALYRAKQERRGSFSFFADGMDAEVRARVNVSAELREALASEQLLLMYQPQVEINSGRIVGLEALVRWRHPTRGILGPGEFVPSAERDGQIVPLGHWVIGEACRQARRWLNEGIALPSIAVNLSGLQFKLPFELEANIAAALAETALPAKFLELELTESVLMEASQGHNDLLLRLRKAGHRLAIDDFGTGYSSLNYLRRYPVDRIKIAQQFISDIGIEPGNDAIVRAALGLARELDIEVVVEGVETAAQLELLKAWGCRIVQGYYFARPLPVPQMTSLFRAGKVVLVRPLEFT